MIAAPGSRQGKTVVTAALARLHRNQGKKVCVLKVGPDFLDPMIHQVATGQPVRNLDWWMMGESNCRKLLSEAAKDNDVVLVESLMGLHDNEPSNAWLANTLSLPVILVMDLAKFAQTAAALVHGMRTYRQPVELAAVIGNRLGSDHHHTLVSGAMPEDIYYAGSIRRDDRMVLPERHLGLVQGCELDDLDRRLDLMASCLNDSVPALPLPARKITEFDSLPYVEPLLRGRRVAIARDQAFGFIYPENIKILERLGAEMVFFSPLDNEPVPEADGLWLPGGYPELHLSSLQKCQRTLESISAFVSSDKPGLAECGGMMLLGSSITSLRGDKLTGVGIFNAKFTMRNRFQSIGYQSLSINDMTIHGHSFHHSSICTSLQPIAKLKKQTGSKGEGLYKTNNTFMTYAHLCFSHNPEFVGRLFSGQL